DAPDQSPAGPYAGPSHQAIAQISAEHVARRAGHERQSGDNAHLGFGEARAAREIGRKPAEVKPGSPGVAPVHRKDEPKLRAGEEYSPWNSRMRAPGSSQLRFTLAKARPPPQRPKQAGDAEDRKGIAPAESHLHGDHDQRRESAAQPAGRPDI